MTVCVYCNTNLRITADPGKALKVEKVSTITSEMIEEVKRLLAAGTKTKAVAYYSQQAGISEMEAFPIVSGIQIAAMYNPPMSTNGVIMLAVFLLVSLVGVIGGIVLIVNGSLGFGIPVVVIAALFGLMNWLSMGLNLKATRIYHWGLPARAEILNRWHVMDTKAGKYPGSLFRLFLEVKPDSGLAYKVETTCLVGEKSLPKFEVGNTIRVKYDGKDLRKVVVVGVDQ
jgi:hypothetical protein